MEWNTNYKNFWQMPYTALSLLSEITVHCTKKLQVKFILKSHI